MACTTPLSEFEFAYLDNDGTTSNLELRLQRGEWIGNYEKDEGVQAVYGWLKLPSQCKMGYVSRKRSHVRI